MASKTTLSPWQRTLLSIIDHLNYTGAHTRPDVVRTNIRRFLDSLAEEVTPFLPDHTRGVDIGAGYGIFSQALHTQGVKCYNLDLEQTHDDQGVRVLGDAHQVPFFDNSLDFVCMMYALPHFENPSKAIEEAARIIKPGGRFIAMMEFARYRGQEALIHLNEQSMNGIIYGHREEDSFHYLSKKTVDDTLTDAGLEVVRTKAYPPTRMIDRVFKTRKELYIATKK